MDLDPRDLDSRDDDLRDHDRDDEWREPATGEIWETATIIVGAARSAAHQS